MMSDTDEWISMYEPWLRTYITRKMGNKCQMVGKQRGGGKEETRRKSWRDVMQEKEGKACVWKNITTGGKGTKVKQK